MLKSAQMADSFDLSRVLWQFVGQRTPELNRAGWQVTPRIVDEATAYANEQAEVGRVNKNEVRDALVIMFRNEAEAATIRGRAAVETLGLDVKVDRRGNPHRSMPPSSFEVAARLDVMVD